MPVARPLGKLQAGSSLGLVDLLVLHTTVPYLVCAYGSWRMTVYYHRLN